MNIEQANDIIERYGFVKGSPSDNDPHLAFVVAEPLHPGETHQSHFGRHVARGYISHGYFTKDDGWIGWKSTVLFYHPATVPWVEDGQYFVSARHWEEQLSQLISA